MSCHAYDSYFIILEPHSWSQWKCSDESWRHHTEHDIEQVQQLYSLCEQSLLNYYSHRNEQQIDDINTPFLSPINLLAVTLWYPKHYHFERCIATEFNLAHKSVAYSLSSVLDILHPRIYPEFISLSTNMPNETTPLGPEEHHKLMVDSTFITIPQSDDSTEHKAYYHVKNPTNYALKVQIVCDFRQRKMHVSECYKDSIHVHGIIILRESGLLEHLINLCRNPYTFIRPEVFTVKKENPERTG